MTKSTDALYKNLPTSDAKLHDHTPEKLFQEVSALLTLDFGKFFFQKENRLARLEKGFENIENSAEQETLLKALLQHQYEALNLSHCKILTDEILKLFLTSSQKTLKTLTLRHCPLLTVKSIPLIAACQNLEELYLSHSGGIGRFVIPRAALRDLPAPFPQLKTLHLGHCNLEKLYLEAPQLNFLKVNHNPALKEYQLSLPSLIEVDDTDSPLAPVQPPFGKIAWTKCFGDIGVEPPLPPDIEKVLNSPCPIWKDKKVYETHLLVLVPQTVNGQPLTLKTLGELVQKPLQGRATQYDYFQLGEYQDPPAPASHWVLMIRDVIPNSRNKPYAEQQALVQNYAGYQVPNILDATVALFMEYVRSGTRLYSNNPSTYTRCQEKLNDSYQLVVGGFAPGGLDVSSDFFAHEFNGVGMLRRF